MTAWDKWYATLPADLRRKLSLHDFKRLGDCFQKAFGDAEIALQEIAEPIVFMQMRAAKNGDKLDGQTALQLANDPNYLRAIARTALITATGEHP